MMIKDEDNQKKEVYSISEFCKAHNICKVTFYNLQKKGVGPKIMRIGSRVLISKEAAKEWRKQMES